MVDDRAGHLVRRVILVAFSLRRRRYPEVAQTTDDSEPILAAGVTVVLPRAGPPKRKADKRPGSPQRLGQLDVVPPRLQPVAEVGFQERLEPLRDPAILHQQVYHLVLVPHVGNSLVHQQGEEVQQQPPADPVDGALGLDEMQHAAHRVEQEHARAPAVRRRCRDRTLEEQVHVVHPAPDDRDHLLAQLIDRRRIHQLAVHAVPKLAPQKPPPRFGQQVVQAAQRGRKLSSMPHQSAGFAFHCGPRATGESETESWDRTWTSSSRRPLTSVTPGVCRV